IVAYSAVALAIVAFGGCGRSRASGGHDHVFRYPIIQEPTTLDPAKIQDVYTNELLQNIFEGLVTFDEQNRVVGALSDRWVISPDGKTYTFHLRTNAKFHSPYGRSVTAEDVKYSLERALRPETGSPTAAGYLSGIVGAEEVAAGKSKELSGVTVVESHMVEI